MSALQQIDQLDPRLHAFITADRDGALRDAAMADADIARGVDRGPLQGVPLSLKDKFATRGLRTTAASPVYENWIPSFDSAAAAALRSSGAVLLGKTSMFELSTGWGTSGHFPHAVNPWNPERSPGGSSSGSAVAVASGMGQASIGSDSGGSVRVPANYCGVVGLKPTYGLISSFGTIPVGPSTSHVGVMTRRVADAALVLEALVGFDARDPASLDVPRQRYAGRLAGHARGIRVGVPWGYIGEYISEENAAALDAALAVLRDAGASVGEIVFPNTDKLADAWTTIVFAELAEYHEERYRLEPDKFGFELKTRLDSGLGTRAIDYIRAQEVRREVRQGQITALESFDIIATPTAPAEAPPLSQLKAREQTARQTRLADTGQLARYTRPYNLSGLPAITIRSGFTATGLPLGLQLAGRPLDDALILQAADAFERRTEWHERRPDLVGFASGVGTVPTVVDTTHR